MNRTLRIPALILGLSLSTAFAAMAQDTTCDPVKSAQFNFWIGHWEVTAGGAVAGHNRIEPILDGCVLQENWTGKGGQSGTSLNYFNPSTGKWHQFWVWQNGLTLPMMTGEYRDGKMVLEGKGPNPRGMMINHRITWYDNADGTVRQHWEISKDGGGSWTTSFDGLYTRKN